MMRLMARHPSPLGGRRPTRTELAQFANKGFGHDDLMGAPQLGLPVKLMIFGINPGLWSAAVNAPFAYPGNRFWPSLFQAGITEYQIDVTAGMSDADEDYLASRGIALTNLVNRATAKASELSSHELRTGAHKAVNLAQEYQPRAVAIVGITAFRTAFGMPKAQLGKQNLADVNRAIVRLRERWLPDIDEWPAEVALWVMPQPSGLNAHETVSSLAERWREISVQLEINCSAGPA